MNKTVIFGGTAEGRKLCEFCSARGVPVLYSAATEDGARQAETLPGITVRAGRLDLTQMTDLLKQTEPALVIDATHPYAQEASRNIAAACDETGSRLLSVIRESEKEKAGAGCTYFDSTDELIPWLEAAQGNIFVTTGVSRAEAFTRLADYRERVWLRILPSAESLSACLNLGYNSNRLICMQGPFSEDLNRAMFLSADAKILVTKESGAAGGFAEKVRAARSLGMSVAVLKMPAGQAGVTYEEACLKIGELIK